jgi:transcriptional regulator with XRE-family HTH domain
VRPDRFRKLVARRCASARHDAGVTVAALATQLRIHVNDVHRVESGDQAPSVGYVAGLAEAADVTCDYLLGRTAVARPWDAVPDNAVPAALLREAILLTHPDRHPPVRRDQATRVTQELNALVDRRGG